MIVCVHVFIHLKLFAQECYKSNDSTLFLYFSYLLAHQIYTPQYFY